MDVWTFACIDVRADGHIGKEALFQRREVEVSFYPLDPLFDLLVVNLFNGMENPNKLVIGLLLFGTERFHFEPKGLLSCL